MANEGWAIGCRVDCGSIIFNLFQKDAGRLAGRGIHPPSHPSILSLLCRGPEWVCTDIRFVTLDINSHAYCVTMLRPYVREAVHPGCYQGCRCQLGLTACCCRPGLLAGMICLRPRCCDRLSTRDLATAYGGGKYASLTTARPVNVGPYCRRSIASGRPGRC